MRQEIYADERDLTDYSSHRTWRVFVHLCSAAQWTAITCEVAPPTPIDREVYVQHGFPWFDYYDADREDLAASETLSKVRTVGDLLGKDDEPFNPNRSVDGHQTQGRRRSHRCHGSLVTDRLR